MHSQFLAGMLGYIKGVWARISSHTQISLRSRSAMKWCVCYHRKTLHHQNNSLLLGDLQRFLLKTWQCLPPRFWHIPEMHGPRSKISSPCSCDKNTTWRLKIDLLWAGEGLPEDEGSSAFPQKQVIFQTLLGSLHTNSPMWIFEGRFPKTKMFGLRFGQRFKDI